MNIHREIRELAKSIRFQNLFLASKEMTSVRIFKNTYDLSKLQELFLSYLYAYDAINRDIATNEVSKRVLDNDLFTDAYLLWKSKNKHNKNKKPESNKRRELNLVAGTKIKFPKEVKKDGK